MWMMMMMVMIKEDGFGWLVDGSELVAVDGRLSEILRLEIFEGVPLPAVD